jgi:hypothetical protein
MPASLRISHTADAATVTPRTRSSPWMRRYPHVLSPGPGATPTHGSTEPCADGRRASDARCARGGRRSDRGANAAPSPHAPQPDLVQHVAGGVGAAERPGRPGRPGRTAPGDLGRAIVVAGR